MKVNRLGMSLLTYLSLQLEPHLRLEPQPLLRFLQRPLCFRGTRLQCLTLSSRAPLGYAGPHGEAKVGPVGYGDTLGYLTFRYFEVLIAEITYTGTITAQT
jgi:hypothetical protein